jgi:hypothetical protein
MVVWPKSAESLLSVKYLMINEILGAPGSTFKIAFDGDGIDQTKPANKEYMSETNTTKIENTLIVNTRECEVGESFTP